MTRMPVNSAFRRDQIPERLKFTVGVDSVVCSRVSLILGVLSIFIVFSPNTSLQKCAFHYFASLLDFSNVVCSNVTIRNCQKITNVASPISQMSMSRISSNVKSLTKSYYVSNVNVCLLFASPPNPFQSNTLHAGGRIVCSVVD